MRTLKVVYPDGSRQWVGECPAAHFPIFAEAFAELLELQAIAKDPFIAFNDGAIASLLRFLSTFLPILPHRRGAFCVDPFLTPLDIPSLTALFYGEDCQILKLHEQPDAPPPLDQDEYTPENMPIPSSGNPTADLLARLSQIDNSTANAQKLMETYDRATLHALFEQVNELRRDPKDRFEEYKQKRLDATIKHAQEHDLELYAKIVGLDRSDSEPGVE